MDPTHRITFRPADGSPDQVFPLTMRRSRWSRQFYADANASSIDLCWDWGWPYAATDRQNGWACSVLPTLVCLNGRRSRHEPGWVPTAASLEFQFVDMPTATVFGTAYSP